MALAGGQGAGMILLTATMGAPALLPARHHGGRTEGITRRYAASCQMLEGQERRGGSHFDIDFRYFWFNTIDIHCRIPYTALVERLVAVIDLAAGRVGRT
jgi:hypothetical protein